MERRRENWLNIKEIAKICGVGVSTVSRVINNSGPVSAATRSKVMQAITEYHFVPNTSAQNLKTSQSRNIALLVKGITSPFFNKIIRVIERQAALRGYPLFIQNVDEISNELDIAIRESKSRNLSGVIILGGYYAYSEEKFRQLGIPCVLITVEAGKDVDPSLYSSVRIDDEKEGFRATEYLIRLGHRRIGFLYNNPAEQTTPNALRYFGYRRALKEYRIPFDPGLVATFSTSGASGFNTGFQLTRQLCLKNRDMTAVFAFADVLAIGAMKAVYSLGLKVPDNISIMGFDGIEMAEYYEPSLDTMYQPASEMALSGIDILFDMIKGRKAQHIVYNCVLLKRGSCRELTVKNSPGKPAAGKGPAVLS